MKRDTAIILAVSILFIFLGCVGNDKKDPPPTYLTGGDSTKIVGTWLPANTQMFFSRGCYFPSPFATLTLNEDGTYAVNDPMYLNQCVFPPEYGSGVVESGTWGTSGNKLIFHPSTGGEYFHYWQYVPEYVDPYFNETHPDTLVLQPSRLPVGAWDPHAYEMPCSRSVIYY